MKRISRKFAGAAAVAAAVIASESATAQKQGGFLHAGHFDSPASMSMLEESTLAVNRPMMGVFNNLVMFNQEVAQNSPQSIVPDLGTGWSWNEEGTELTMPLRRGVRWHDGQPFTASDVKCTWDLLTGKGNDKLRINPRKSWYDNLDSVTTNGSFEVIFHLKRPQPSFLTLLASGWSPVYPCHGRVEDGRGSWGPMAITPFPISAHRTGGPDFRSPALRLASPQGTRRGNEWQAFEAQQTEFPIDRVVREPAGAAPCHFVPSCEEVAHALVGIAVNTAEC